MTEHLFIKEGEYWTIIFDGRLFRMRESKGLVYIARLLGAPGKRVTALDLQGKAGPGERQSATKEGTGDGDSSLAERARINVTRAIRSAEVRISKYDPALAGHFRTALKTGGWCSYSPEPATAVRWRLESVLRPENEGISGNQDEPAG